MATLDTKEIILEIASRLFADRGFDNTSIRDISKEAKVNTSAINYHFQSKAGLYSEVINSNIEMLREKIAKIETLNTTTEDYTIEIYKLFMNQSSPFFNSMRMFLMNNIPLDKSIVPKSCLKEPDGPPGTNALIDMITKELNFEGERDQLIWAARNILHNIIIIALLGQSSFVKVMKDDIVQFSDEEKIDSIRKNVRSTLNFIK